MSNHQQVTLNLASQWETTPDIIAYIRSCNKNYHLNRQEIIERQEKKIEGYRYGMAKHIEASNTRKRLAKEEPQNSVKHLEKAAKIDEHIEKEKKSSMRAERIAFLQRLTDADFKKIIL